MSRTPRVYLALLHYPIYNKNMDVITSSVTNLDLHDISRVVRTYNLAGYCVVHPSPKQHELIARIVGFWQEGYGGSYNPDRREAFERLSLFPSIEEAIEHITAVEGQPPVTISTDARVCPGSLDYLQARRLISESDRPWLILFGTGWGIVRDLIDSCDYVLTPVAPGSDYNHLSVRSAVAIIVDRLFGENWFRMP